MNRKKCFLLVALIWNLALSLVMANSKSPIGLKEVIQRFGKGNAFGEERRYAVKIGTKEGEFVAKKMKFWSLTFTFDQVSPIGSEISDDPNHEIIMNCLDRFLADVPNAKVERIQLEWRALASLWSAYKSYGKTFFEGYGKIVDVKAMEEEFNLGLNKYLSGSNTFHNFEKEIANKLGEDVKSSSCVSENWGFLINEIGKNSRDLADLPNFGLAKPQAIAIYLVNKSN